MIYARITLTTPSVPITAFDQPNWRTAMALLDDLVAKVSALTTVDDSVVALLTDLKTRLDAAGSDPAKLQALSDAIGAQTQRLQDAVTVNTPAA